MASTKTSTSRSTSTSTSTSISLPSPFSHIPRHPLLLGPSPIHALPRISASLNPKVHIYAKREDINSAHAAGGGNKTRKLEYLVAEALATGCDTLVSIGGYQSNHTRAVASAAASLGLKCKLVQEKWVDWHDAGYDRVGNIQLSRLMGADVRIASDQGFGIQHKHTLQSLTDEVIRNGGKPYYIPAGASDHPLGGLGFARWAYEVRQQELEMGLFFDVVIVCAVTGSTFAGMIAGFKAMEKAGISPPRKIVGFDASAKPKATFDQVLRIARFTAMKIGLKAEDISEEDVILDDRYHAGCYGIPDEQTVAAIKFGAQTEAFITDPVYEGKSLAGMMDMVRRGEIEDGKNVLYAHLGGQWALNAYTDM